MATLLVGFSQLLNSVYYYFKMKTLCFIFLGNPGREYERTRHNFGWLVADSVFSNNSQNFWSDKFEGKLAFTDSPSGKFLWFKPQKFMNLSGSAVRKLLDFYKLTIDEIIVVHDDLELPFGQIAFKQNGGSGGHNGLRSLDQHLGSNSYIRFRLGIGRPKHGDVASFVLARFSSDEEISLPLVLEKAKEELLRIVSGTEITFTKIQAFQEFKASKKS